MIKKNKDRSCGARNLNLTHAYLRRDYRSQGLLEVNVSSHPMRQFALWFEQALKKKTIDANAFVLATADPKARPAARVLLMKGYSLRGITFFTNYQSAKGKQIDLNPYGEAVFFWNGLNRQVRLSGRIVRLSRKEALRYFRSRPWMAQVAACVSEQSQSIKSRAELEARFEDLKKFLQGSAPDVPAAWGGYELQVFRAEFWQGRLNRLHDRICYDKKKGGGWKKSRLQP